MNKKDSEIIAKNYRELGLPVPKKMGFDAMAKDYIDRGVMIADLHEKLDERRDRVIRMSVVLGVVSSLLIVQGLYILVY